MSFGSSFRGLPRAVPFRREEETEVGWGAPVCFEFPLQKFLPFPFESLLPAPNGPSFSKPGGRFDFRSAEAFFLFPPRLAGGGEAGETAAQNGRPKTCPSFVSEGKRSLSASFFLPSLSGDANLGPLGTWRRRAAIPFPAAVRKGDRPASPDLPPSGRNLAPILLPPLLTHKGEKSVKCENASFGGQRGADGGGREGGTGCAARRSRQPPRRRRQDQPDVCTTYTFPGYTTHCEGYERADRVLRRERAQKRGRDGVDRQGRGRHMARNWPSKAKGSPPPPYPPFLSTSFVLALPYTLLCRIMHGNSST